MKPLTLSMVLAAASAWFGFVPQAHAQWVRQSIQLKPGWNAVFLEVDPEPGDCDTLFSNVAVESVWDYTPSVDSPQFIQDPSTLIPGTPGWLVWFPDNHPLAGQSTLFTLRDGRAYLIKLAPHAQATNWVVIGKPSLRRLTWRPEALNLVGFRVGDQPPSFQTLFAGEPGLAGQPVYALDSTGIWRAFPDLSKAKPKAGEAYWIRCRLPAQRTATIEVDAGSRQGLTFSSRTGQQSIRIRNTSPGARKISVKLIPSAQPPPGQSRLAGPVPLEYHYTDQANTNFVWKPFSAPLSFARLPAGQEWNIRLGARRAGLTSTLPGSRFQSLLEITDDLGTRWVIPVAADPAGAAASAFASGLALASPAPSTPHAGLWVGEAVLDAVSMPSNPTDPSTPRRAGGEFSFRLILHVDAGGTARLLREVFVVRKPPTVVPDPDDPGSDRVDQPAREAIVTDESLITGIIGEGDIIGRRISSPAFAFKEPIPLAGGAFGDGTLTGAVSLDYDHPLNPFKHTYHPDHNNLDERFEEKLPEGKEAFTVTRSLSLEFTGEDPLGLNPPTWGDSELGGTYRETISGLHRQPIQVSGTFRLVRISEMPALNQ